VYVICIFLAESDIVQRDRTINVVVTGNTDASLPGFNKLSNTHQHRDGMASQHTLHARNCLPKSPQPTMAKPIERSFQRPKEHNASYLVRTSLQRDTYNKQCNSSLT
jgi:hypothetical protein